MLERLADKGQHVVHEALAAFRRCFEDFAQECAKPLNVELAEDFEAELCAKSEHEAILARQALDEGRFVDALPLVGEIIQPAPNLVCL